MSLMSGAFFSANESYAQAPVKKPLSYVDSLLQERRVYRVVFQETEPAGPNDDIILQGDVPEISYGGMIELYREELLKCEKGSQKYYHCLKMIAWLEAHPDFSPQIHVEKLKR